ncbi:MAG: glycoside hydrolase family 3, partial [Deltaproteobacteria bacterium]|nr:glycoside hydrolase family 3 [Deltaproteobacteria bacterium]
MRICCLLLFLALLPSPAKAAALPETLPLDAMIGQMVMVGFRGDGSSPHTPEMRVILEDIRSGRIGGVIFFDRDWQTKKRGRNITSVTQLTRLCALLQKNAPIPLFIAVDQEGGRVRRLRPDHGFPATLSAEELGRKKPEDTREAARNMGEALRRIGVNVNFAPVADIAVHPESPAIGALGRAFSSDPEEAARHAAAFMEGLSEAGVIGSYKHFPGHGSALADSHHKLTDITATWSEKELAPYANLPATGPFLVMTGHLLHKGLDPRYPASLSPAVTTGLLRGKLGWQGVVVTDDLEMDAIDLFYSMEERIKLAIDAGVDIILFGNNLRHPPEPGRRVHAAIAPLVRTGAVSP